MVQDTLPFIRKNASWMDCHIQEVRNEAIAMAQTSLLLSDWSQREAKTREERNGLLEKQLLLLQTINYKTNSKNNILFNVEKIFFIRVIMKEHIKRIVLDRELNYKNAFTYFSCVAWFEQT
jgi:hypothetical protein